MSIDKYIYTVAQNVSDQNLMSLLLSIILKAETAIQYYTHVVLNHTGPAENDRIVLVVRPRQRRSIDTMKKRRRRKNGDGGGGGERHTQTQTDRQTDRDTERD